jgi:hypothetical protein
MAARLSALFFFLNLLAVFAGAQYQGRIEGVVKDAA